MKIIAKLLFVFIIFTNCSNNAEKLDIDKATLEKFNKELRKSIAPNTNYYFEFKLVDYNKIKAFRPKFKLNPFHQFRDCDIYFVLNVEGYGKFLVPQKHDDVNERNVACSIIGPKEWIRKKCILEVWEDKKDENQFWQFIFAATKVKVSLEDYNIPIPLNFTFQLDENKVYQHTFVDDEIITQYEFNIPPKGNSENLKVVPQIEFDWYFSMVDSLQQQAIEQNKDKIDSNQIKQYKKMRELVDVEPSVLLFKTLN